MIDWELKQDKIAVIIENLLFAQLGFNPDDSHLKDTPKRVAKFWREFLD